MMKIKLILLTLIISTTALAAENSLDNLNLMQLYLDKNQLEKVEDLYDENEDELSKNPMALERLAISFERREKYKEAIGIYKKLITTQNDGKNKQQYYYYKLAFLNTQLFGKTNSYSPKNDRDDYKKNAENFIALSRQIKADDGELKLLEDLLQEKINNDEKLAYKSHYYASLDLISWQDRLYLVSLSSGSKTNLLSTAIGTCIGGGKKWENVNYEFDLEGCFAVLTATISSEDRNIKYQQSSVAVKGFVAGPGMYFKTFSDNVLLGVHIPVKYRQGDWTNPDKTQYRFEREKTFEAGYFLQSKIKIKNISLRTRLGKVLPNPGSLWSIGLLYEF